MSQSESKSDSRKIARSHIQQVILVRDVYRDVEIGRVVNLHEEGFMLIGGPNIRENCVYQLKLELTDAVDGVNILDVGGECLWVREAAGEDRVWAGFHIVDVAAEDLTILKQLKLPPEE